MNGNIWEWIEGKDPNRNEKQTSREHKEKNQEYTIRIVVEDNYRWNYLYPERM